jgi:RNA polymerase primary sigma factor
MRQLKITKSITNRESQSLEKYLQEIGKVDLLTPEKEVDLAKKIKQGDQIALETLTKANLRFRSFRCQAIPKPGSFPQ